jgi:hypothetical protein
MSFRKVYFDGSSNYAPKGKQQNYKLYIPLPSPLRSPSVTGIIADRIFVSLGRLSDKP